ncbi:hypothetical protein BDC45DRAFT_565515 [Circinella umbellata]|nr:hypothetical protein BDC45DRAFT_565515 [Circinella umbellata]
MTEVQDHSRCLICPVIHELAEVKCEISIQDIIDKLENTIVDTWPNVQNMADSKSDWIRRINLCASSLNITLLKQKPNWKKISKRIEEKTSINEPDNSSPSKKLNTTSCSGSTALEVPLSPQDKNDIAKMLDNLDRDNFWVLNATIKDAIKTKTKPKSVEEKIRDFAVSCNFVHPSQSLILDVEDHHWIDVFTTEELKEIRKEGGPILRPIPKDLEEKLKDLQDMTSALQAYRYGHQLDHDPINDHLMSWLSETLVVTSRYFLKGNCNDIESMKESDKLYYLWGFLNKIFFGSSVKALGKEMTSEANAAALNGKRKLSAVDATNKKKMGRRTDTIYKASGVELDCLEIGHQVDSTKEMKDSMIKLPIVLKDMLCAIVQDIPSIINQTHILGYNINGNSVVLLDANVPKGYVTRIRRINPIPYPTCSDDYIQRIIPLLKIAVNGKMIIDSTLNKYRSTAFDLIDTGDETAVLPPCFIPRRKLTTPSSSLSLSSAASATTPETSSSTSSSLKNRPDQHVSKKRR